MLTLYFWNILNSFLDPNVITAIRKITHFIKMEKLFFPLFSRWNEVQISIGIFFEIWMTPAVNKLWPVSIVRRSASSE